EVTASVLAMAAPIASATGFFRVVFMLFVSSLSGLNPPSGGSLDSVGAGAQAPHSTALKT
ncbi:MAG TPA: hypothetical protein VLA56_08475, partial [Pseudomonadales bacterium]|nr:hypothetical protein [Pseudomonadales bacterium]